jgi:hypothetical protein
VGEPLYFVDFLREPVVDEETGETLEAHPSNYEAVPGGLAEIRTRVEALQRKFNKESKVSEPAADRGSSRLINQPGKSVVCLLLSRPYCTVHMCLHEL